MSNMDRYMKRSWLNVGRAFTSDGQSREAIARTMDALIWKPWETQDAAALGPVALALVELAHAAEIPAPELFAFSGNLGTEAQPLALLAVQGSFKNGVVRVYALDDTKKVTVVATDFLERGLYVAGRLTSGQN